MFISVYRTALCRPMSLLTKNHLRTSLRRPMSLLAKNDLRTSLWRLKSLLTKIDQVGGGGIFSIHVVNIWELARPIQYYSLLWVVIETTPPISPGLGTKGDSKSYQFTIIDHMCPESLDLEIRQMDHWQGVRSHLKLCAKMNFLQVHKKYKIDYGKNQQMDCHI